VDEIEKKIDKQMALLLIEQCIELERAVSVYHDKKNKAENALTDTKDQLSKLLEQKNSMIENNSERWLIHFAINDLSIYKTSEVHIIDMNKVKHNKA
jgi:hypothetical protein